MKGKRILALLLAAAVFCSLCSCIDVSRFLPDSDPDPYQTDTGSEPVPTETETSSETGTAPATETGTEPATEPDSGTETETDSETASESETDSAIDVNGDPEGYNPIIPGLSDIPPLLSSVQLFRSYDYDTAENDDGSILATASWEQLSLAPVTEANHPGLASSLKLFNENIRLEAEADLRELAELGRSHPVSDGDPYGVTIRILVKRSDEKALSLLIQKKVDDVDSTRTTYDSVVYSPDTGEVLPITQMIYSEGALLEAFVREFTMHYQNTYVSEPEVTFGKVLSENKIPWVLEPAGLTFYMSPGTYADPSEGLLKINLPFSYNSELYPGDITDAPDSYVIPFCAEETLQIPALNGGMRLDAWVTYDEYNVYYEALHVQLDATQYDFERSGIDADFYFVKSFDRKLLVVDSSQVGSHGDFTIFSLESDGRVLFQANLEGESLNGAYYTADGYGDFVFTDPECFLLSSKIDNLSTYTGIRLFSFDGGIVPQPADQAYLALCDFKLTLKRDLDLDLLYNETRRPTGTKVTVPEGTELSFVRTDRSGFVEMTDGNGLYVRVNLDSPASYPPKINGIPADELFDGIMYAG